MFTRRKLEAHQGWRQRGASLLEGLMFMIVAGVIIAGVLTNFRDALFGNKTNDAQRDLLTLQGKIRETFYSQSSYAGVTGEALISAGIVPATLKKSSTEMVNRFGGSITIAASGTSNEHFTIAYANVPREACVKMLTQTQASIWYSVGVGSTTYVDGTSLPPTLAQANTACTAATTNTVTWTSY